MEPVPQLHAGAITAMWREADVKYEKLGFMSGEISVPDDLDSLAAEEMIRLFEGKSS
jgi:hypothetical protein